MNIVLDLDGTILDVNARYYYVHTLSARSTNSIPIVREEYRTLRKKGLEEKEIAAFVTENIQKHMQTWNDKIESIAALQMDALQDGIVLVLQKLRQHHKLYLVTLRRNRALLEKQLLELSITDYFQNVFTGSPDDQPSTFKAALIAGKIECDVLIGDTEVDIKTAELLGTKLVAAAYGLRGEVFLKSKGAKNLVSSPAGIPSALNYM